MSLDEDPTIRYRLRRRRLAAALSKRRISQNRWAQMLGLDRGHLSKLLSGQRRYPSADTRRRLLEVLEIPFDELFEAEPVISKRPERSRASAPLPGPRPAYALSASAIWGDFRFGCRLLSRRPGFAALAVLALTVGIGASTLIFSVVNSVLINPFPYRDGDRLVSFWGSGSWSQAELAMLWESAPQSFDGIAAYGFSELTYAGADGPTMLSGVAASANLLSVLGVEPSVGRVFASGEDEPGAEPVVVLSDRLWRRLFGADPGVVGRRVSLSAAPHTVVGVMPPEFFFPSREAEFWVTESIDPQFRGRNYLFILGRLAEGVSIEQAESNLAAVGPAFREAFRYPPEFDKFADGMFGTLELVPLARHMVGGVRNTLLLLLGAVSVVLLIACLNVANLFLSRLISRRREISLRLALGAARSRIALQLLMESLGLALPAGLLAVVSTYWAVGAVAPFLPAGLPRRDEIAVDQNVLMYSLAITLATCIIFGLAPALRACRTDPQPGLAEDGRTPRGGRGRRLNGALVVAEVGLALMLVIAAGLMFRSLQELDRVDAGFEAGNLMTFVLTLDDSAAETRTPTLAAILSRLESIPGVSSAGAIQSLPIVSLGWLNSVRIEGFETAADEAGHTAYYRMVAGNYFEALGIPVLRGRALGDEDRDSAAHVCVVSRSMADRYWPGENPIGKRLKTNPDRNRWLHVVGVVGDVRANGLHREPPPVLYRPYPQNPMVSRLYVAVRSALPPPRLMSAVRSAVAAAAPGVPVFGERTMQAVVDESTRQRRLLMLLLSVMGAVATLLGVIGVYGIIAHAVRERTYEIGVRIALGARRPDIISMVVRQGLLLITAGLLLGLGISLPAGRLLQSWLFEVPPADLATFGVAASAFVLAGLAASYIPARRATRIDPNVTLRSE